MTASTPRPFVVRAATREDLPGVAKLAAELVRFHHALDANRFLSVDEPIEDGYRRFLASEMKNEKVVVLAAVDEETRAVLGYAYGRLEPRDWNMLLEAHGALHDVLVSKDARKSGVGEALVREMCARLEALGAPRVLLHTAVQNDIERAPQQDSIQQRANRAA
jgi:ribosomal protein S18 acetylase RimI-like enzyme